MILLGPDDPPQQPAHVSIPDRKGSWGDEIVDWCRAMGVPIDPEQARDIDIHASYGPGGAWSAVEAVEIEGRQNGKTSSVVLPMTLADLWLFPRKDAPADRVIWTSHLMKTSLDIFDTICRLIDQNPEMSRRVKEIRKSKTDQGVDFHNGWSLDIMARTGGGGRGLTKCKALVFDEALFLRVDAMGALLPTMRTHPNPQVRYASSAGKPESDHLRSLMRRGRAGGDASLSYVEYRADGGWDHPGCADGRRCTHLAGVKGCRLDDEAQWVKANHAIRRGRMGLPFLRAEQRALRQTPEGVLEAGRELLGWEESGDDPASHPISLADWDELAVDPDDPAAEPTGIPAFFIDVSPLGRSAAIGVASLTAAGKPHVALAGYRGGIDWVLDRCKELAEQHPLALFAATKAGGFGVIEHQFRVAYLEVELWTEQEVARACGHAGKLVADGGLSQDGDQLASAAVQVAVKKDVGDGMWSFTRKGQDLGVDLAPLYAEVGALWLLEKMTTADYNVSESVY